MHLVVVGGGAAGSLLSLMVLKRTSTVQVTLVDRRSAFGRGLAYAEGEAFHRLNVPAVKMGGVDPSDDAGFMRWLDQTGRTPGSFEQSFVPRSWFGDYLVSELEAVRPTDRLRLVAADLTTLRRRPDGRWHCSGPGLSLHADVVVLCSGNPTPTLPPSAQIGHRFVPDVWAPRAMDQIGKDQAVILMGSGATAIDAVLALVARGHHAPLTMLSRRGYLPLVDVPPGTYPDFLHPDGKSPTLRAALASLRREVREAAAADVPWQWVLDAFRSHVGRLWSSFDDRERKRFLRHLRAVWMIHRHRLAPDIASRMARMRERGELAVVAGRPMRIEAGADACRVIYRPRGGELERSLEADWILNCVGPSEDLARVDDPLWADLFGSGLVRAGPLGLGLDVDPALRLIDSQGHVHPDLFALGLPTRGRFWEVTAVIHIRQQAEALAARLALAQQSPSMVA